jgi:hypothetical protein
VEFVEKKLTLVVTCTERKSLAATPELQLRSLQERDVERRGSNWAKRFRSTNAPKRTLVDLYRGETWTATARVATTAVNMGYTTRVLVASAGLGLRDVSDEAPGYAATFSPRQADSCGSNRAEQSAWWRVVNRKLNGLELAKLRGRIVLILSEAYATALHDDLVALADLGAADVLLFGGGTDIAGIHRIPAVRDLRSHLGGTVTALNARSAEAWLEQDYVKEFWSPRLEASWGEFVGQVSKPERYNRDPMTDAEVTAFIATLLAEQPRLSKSVALRQLRDSGRACEQKRFGKLFEGVITA